MRPKAMVMDMSTVSCSTKGLDELPEFHHVRPGFTGIMKAEQASFDAEGLLENKEFESLEEANAYLQRHLIGRTVPKRVLKTPFQKAQRLVYDSIDAGKKKRLELARKALELYDGCADALLILAEYEEDASKRLDLLEQAVRAGEKVLKEEGIPIPSGDKAAVTAWSRERAGRKPATESKNISLWSLRIRPYMRARTALAQLLFETGRKEEAVSHYREMLLLNPTDNLGIRHLLLHVALDLGFDDEAREIIREHRDAGADWDYAEAYLSFKEKGDNPVARSFLLRGFYANPHLFRFLLGESPILRTMPGTFAFGSEEEAVLLAAALVPRWQALPGAINLVQQVFHDVTGGLPFPFYGSSASLSREAGRLLRSMNSGKRPAAKSMPLALALYNHPEFMELWTGTSGKTEPGLLLGDLDPLEHIAQQAAVEELLVTPVGSVAEESRKVISLVEKVGLGRHEGMHLLVDIYTYQWDLAVEQDAPFDVDAFIRKLKYVQGFVSLPHPVDLSRNEPCPCGSARKHKRCCGKDEGWPLMTLIALGGQVQAGCGKVKNPGSVYLIRRLQGGRFSRVDLRNRLQDDPLVVLANAAAVAAELREQGYIHAAILTAENNVRRARLLEDKSYLLQALLDLIEMSLTESWSYMVEDYGPEAAVLAEGQQRSFLWGLVAYERLDRWNLRGAEDAIQKAMAVEEPALSSILIKGQLYEAQGRPQDAEAAYRQVLDSFIDHKDYSASEEALQKLESLQRKARRKTGRIARSSPSPEKKDL